MQRYHYWTCGGCGETLQGIEDADGDFISDRELESDKPKHLRAVGCYLCGCPHGEAGEHCPTAADYATQEDAVD